MTVPPVGAAPGDAAADAPPFTIPELARGVRALGGAGDPLARACLTPLLAMRRTLVGVADPARQLALADAAMLRRVLWRAISQLAAERAPEGGARQRAEEARLEEAAAPLLQALGRLAAAAAALETALHQALDPAPDGSRPGRAAVAGAWTAWVTALQGVFRTAGELRDEGG